MVWIFALCSSENVPICCKVYEENKVDRTLSSKVKKYENRKCCTPKKFVNFPFT